jgi:hypothetical protein
MNCNIISIFILLLIIVIIGLIVFSQKQDKLFIENFSFNPSIASNNIIRNNTILSSLMSNLKNYSPSINDANYDSNTEQQMIFDNITSNINIINNSLSDLYNSSTNINTDRITKLENMVTDLENMTYNLQKELIDKKKYTLIKSLNNGIEMNLTSTPNTVFRDERTGSNLAAYMVNVNDGCLSVGVDDYDIYKCNDKNTKQYFKMEHILNETAYQKAIDSALPFDNIDKSSINYPFVMLKSVNNENCLTNNHGTLTVQPCYSFLAQRWMAL